ncbi:MULTISPECIES: helix-turn-helix transcriptional regulator [Flavobacteriaceae]|uniref:helix-turn-helix transcriptional regulator n=1 Tax=Flavobacteriaceae TaxID=49546 RepID=UPI001491BCC6|nr:MULTISPECIES: helix-turn-helix transcriptional regulator [Allomuricauda]MDC6364592.1 helix-turn-helix transcriptional regulator [Muricauda sp. AC10]
MNNTIVARIKSIIGHYDLSVSSFADQIGVQRSSVSHLLSGRNKPSLDFVMKLIKAYPEVNLYWLLEGKGSFPALKNTMHAPTLNFDEDTLASKQQEPENHTPEISINSNKQPVRVLLFYGDGTFESFETKK